MLRFEITLAVRHLRSGGGQTALTVSAVAAGVIVVVFISSLIFGLQQRIKGLLTDLFPHVIVTPLERDPVPLAELPGAPDGITSSRVERATEKRTDIDDWRRMERVIRGIPRVTAIAPAVTGQGFLARGGQRLGVQVFGAEPVRLDAVTPVSKYLVGGRYAGLGGDEIVISFKAADELGVSRGGRVRLTSSQGRSDSFLIVGIYDTGQDRRIGSRAYISLRAAQSLFATGAAVESLLVRGADLFDAEPMAQRMEALLPVDAQPWSEESPEVVAGLGAQRASAILISGFSLVASSFAIASVLIVSVLQKSREIGILKSMGARRRQILTVFLLEGLGIALVGAALGGLLGTGLVGLLTLFKQPVTRVGAQPEQLFPAALSWPLIAAAILAAVVATVLAAVLPARRAAALDPVEVIR